MISWFLQDEDNKRREKGREKKIVSRFSRQSNARQVDWDANIKNSGRKEDQQRDGRRSRTKWTDHAWCYFAACSLLRKHLPRSIFVRFSVSLSHCLFCRVLSFVVLVVAVVVFVRMHTQDIWNRILTQSTHKKTSKTKKKSTQVKKQAAFEEEDTRTAPLGRLVLYMCPCPSACPPALDSSASCAGCAAYRVSTECACVSVCWLYTRVESSQISRVLPRNNVKVKRVPPAQRFFNRENLEF